MKRLNSILAAAALGSLAVPQVALAQAQAAQSAPARAGAITGETEALASGTPGWLLAATAIAAGLFIWAVIDDNEDGLPGGAPVSP